METLSTPYTGYTLVSAYKKVLSNYATFSGRAVRSEYWFFVLANFIIGFILSFFDMAIFGEGRQFLGGLYNLAILIPSLAVSVRRLHDIGKSGLNVLWNLLPVIGTIIFLVYVCKDTQKGANQYGPSEKYPEA